MPSYFLALLSLFFCLFACDQGTNSATGSPEAETIEADENVRDDTERLTALQRQLSGKWKRTTYPYGTLTFEGDRFLNNIGEGMPEEPQFEPYTLAADCRGEDPENTDYLITEGGCSSVTLDGDTLRMGVGQPGSTIPYVRYDGAE